MRESWWEIGPFKKFARIFLLGAAFSFVFSFASITLYPFGYISDEAMMRYAVAPFTGAFLLAALAAMSYFIAELVHE